MAKIESWNKNNVPDVKRLRNFPTEYMLRSVFSKSYCSNFRTFQSGSKVLDIGSLYANNLVPFFDRECDLYGLEVTDDMVQVSLDCCKEQGIIANVVKGSNRKIPFGDGFFDLILSIVTIHYEENMALIREGLREMARCISSDGCLVISTAGKEHDFYRTAEPLGDDRYKIAFDGDFRKGQVFTFFRDEVHFKEELQQFFTKVEVAVVTEKYPSSTLQFYVGKCFL